MIPSDSILVIANPVAGSHAAPHHAQEVGRLLRQAGKRVQIRLTSGPDAAYRFAKDAVREGTPIVVGAGGDGTLREIAAALQSTDTALGILPTGTCNDFARAVGVAKTATPERLAASIIRGATRRIDLGRAGPHAFLTVATFGLASAVNRFVESRKSGSRGTPAYLYGLVRLLLGYRSPQVRFRGDFGERQGRFLLAAIGNTPWFGGNLPITPLANFTDGQFQVCLVNNVSALTVLAALPRLFRGTHPTHPAVKVLNTRFLEIETAHAPDWICADGQSLCQTPCRLEVLPNALAVVVPA